MWMFWFGEQAGQPVQLSEEITAKDQKTTP